MGLIQNRIVFFGSWAVLVISAVWFTREQSFEAGLTALASLVGIAANRDLLPSFSGKRRQLTPAEKIAARDKWRPIFDEYFQEAGRRERLGDAIIHDVDRLDEYPNAKKTKGISAWFRAGLMGTYHRGILLGLQWVYLEEKDGEYVEIEHDSNSDKVKAMLIGEVPYESIESVNFNGDPYYNKPHIFCHFDFGGEPYERFFYGQQFQLDPNMRYHYTELAEYKPKKRPRFKALFR